MNYEAIFRERGAAYSAAMARWPNARRDEFLLPIQRAALRPGECVGDVPAGGGYLRGFLPTGVSWLGHEPCASFFTAGAASDVPLLPLPWADSSLDAVLSIAGVHHLDDRRPLYREVARVLAPGGRCVLADVPDGSAVAEFLDDFVGAFNSTGHSGRYLTAADGDLLSASGLRVTASERLRYAWWFPRRADVGAFCQLLFDMNRATPDQVLAGVSERLGTTTRGDETGMHWELHAFTAVKPG